MVPRTRRAGRPALAGHCTSRIICWIVLQKESSPCSGLPFFCSLFNEKALFKLRRLQWRNIGGRLGRYKGTVRTEPSQHGHDGSVGGLAPAFGGCLAHSAEHAQAAPEAYLNIISHARALPRTLGGTSTSTRLRGSSLDIRLPLNSAQRRDVGPKYRTGHFRGGRGTGRPSTSSASGRGGTPPDPERRPMAPGPVPQPGMPV